MTDIAAQSLKLARALRDAINAHGDPHTPEGFCYAMTALSMVSAHVLDAGSPPDISAVKGVPLMAGQIAGWLVADIDALRDGLGA